MARRLLGLTNAQDEGLTEQLVSERRRRTRLDGGIGGWVVATSWGAWELLQLGCPSDHTGVVRMTGYLLSRQDQPGRFGEGCEASRHSRGHCHHHLSGFFSPGPVETPIAPLTLPFGAVIEGEWSARFAASCFALRTVLQARQERRPAVIAHVESLLDTHRRWIGGDFEPSTPLALFALGGLALAPPAYRTDIEDLARRIISRQRDDGEWAGTSLFHAMDTLLTLSIPETLESIRIAAPGLIGRQNENGSFDEAGDEELALVALRALKTLGAGRSTPKPPRFSSPGARPTQRRRNRAGR